MGQIEVSRVSNVSSGYFGISLTFSSLFVPFFLRRKKMHLEQALSPFAGHRLFSAPSSARARASKKAARSANPAVVVRAEVGTGRGMYSFRRAR